MFTIGRDQKQTTEDLIRKEQAEFEDRVRNDRAPKLYLIRYQPEQKLGVRHEEYKVGVVDFSQDGALKTLSSELKLRGAKIVKVNEIASSKENRVDLYNPQIIRDIFEKYGEGYKEFKEAEKQRVEKGGPPNRKSGRNFGIWGI